MGLNYLAFITLVQAREHDSYVLSVFLGVYLSYLNLVINQPRHDKKTFLHIKL